MSETPSQGQSVLVYALGQIGFEYRSVSFEDSLRQAGIGDPNLPSDLLRYLDENPEVSSEVVWTLCVDDTPIYALVGTGPYAFRAYERFRSFLGSQISPMALVDRVSVPGVTVGNTQLRDGIEVPMIAVATRGMYRWSTRDLINANIGPRSEADDVDAWDHQVEEFQNFLDRVYYELRNMGQSAEDRALNFAATNAFQAANVFAKTQKKGLVLGDISTAPSSIQRANSECWEVRLNFFDPSDRSSGLQIEAAFTVDISEQVPVTVGKTRFWYVR